MGDSLGLDRTCRQIYKGPTSTRVFFFFFFFPFLFFFSDFKNSPRNRDLRAIGCLVKREGDTLHPPPPPSPYIPNPSPPRYIPNPPPPLPSLPLSECIVRTDSWKSRKSDYQYPQSGTSRRGHERRRALCRPRLVQSDTAASRIHLLINVMWRWWLPSDAWMSRDVVVLLTCETGVNIVFAGVL